MKNKIFSAIVMAFVLVSCNQQGKKDGTTESRKPHHDSRMTKNDTIAHSQSAEADGQHGTLFACEMHPEIQGKKEDKCSKCGMKLSEPVAEKSEEK